MEAGRVRGAGEEVSVGAHLPPSGGPAVEAFLDRFAECCGRLDRLGSAQRLCAIAAAHHRLLHLHPFDDGNGRVARLDTHAMLLQAGYGASGPWSVSRGLARGLRLDAAGRPAFHDGDAAMHPTARHKMLTAHADAPRLGDLDGRDNQSRRRLAEATEWFLAVAADQMQVTARHLSLESILRRLGGERVQRRGPRPHAGRGPRPHAGRGPRPDAGRVLLKLARLGRFLRATVRTIIGVSARTAAIVAELIADGIVASDSPKGELRLRTPRVKPPWSGKR